MGKSLFFGIMVQKITISIVSLIFLSYWDAACGHNCAAAPCHASWHYDMPNGTHPIHVRLSYHTTGTTGEADLRPGETFSCDCQCVPHGLDVTADVNGKNQTCNHYMNCDHQIAYSIQVTWNTIYIMNGASLAK